MHTVAIVQARMGSTRLPGKVLLPVGGQSVLSRVLHRLKRTACIDEIVVATSVARREYFHCRRKSAPGSARCFRGSEDDVLDRYHGAAQESGADALVRITSDCPLVDPEVVDEVIESFRRRRVDYASNGLSSNYPRGLNVEVFSVQALEKAWGEAHEPHQREHVTPYFYEHPELFRLFSMVGNDDYSQYRWTLDTAEDLEFLRAIYLRFGDADDFGWQDVIALMKREPELAALNSHVQQKSLRKA